MKKIYSLSLILALSFFISGMSKPLDKEVSSSAVEQKSAKSKSNYTKPHAGIFLDYQSPAKLQIGDSLALELHFKVRAQAEHLQVKVSLGDALLLQSDSQYEFDTAITKNISIILLATALKEDSARINLSATILVDGKHQSRSFSIPVIVGDPAKFKSNAQTIENSGYKVDKARGVVSMPAVESSN